MLKGRVVMQQEGVPWTAVRMAHTRCDKRTVYSALKELHRVANKGSSVLLHGSSFVNLAWPRGVITRVAPITIQFEAVGQLPCVKL
jgi:hypothetical protein